MKTCIAITPTEVHLKARSTGMAAKQPDFSERLIAAFNSGRPDRIEGMPYEHLSDPKIRLGAATRDFRLLLTEALGQQQADMLIGATATCRKCFEWAEGHTDATTFFIRSWMLTGVLNLEQLARLPGAVAIAPFDSRDGFMTYQATLQTKVDTRHPFIVDRKGVNPEWTYRNTAILYKAAEDNGFRALVPGYRCHAGKETRIAPRCKVRSLDRDSAKIEMDPAEAVIAADQYQI